MRTAAQPAVSRAFSLVEMIVVLMLLIVLVIMSGSRFSASARKRDLLACQANLQKIYIALGLYRADNDAYPLAPDAQTSEPPLSLLVPKDTTDTAVFICPGSSDPALPQGERFAGRNISYAFYMGRAANGDPADILMSDRQVNTLPKEKGGRVFSLDGKKPANNHRADGGNLLSCGGEVAQSGPKASRDLLFPSTVRLLNP
jgi:type II secretory pathway pseudopilin PulG